MFRSSSQILQLGTAYKVPEFNFPAEPPGRPKPYLRPRQLQQWCNELPISNTATAAHQMLETLKSLNKSRYPHKERLQLHNAVRPVFNELLQAIRIPLRQVNLPLDQQQQHRVQLIQQLLEQMAMGYKRVVHELGKTSRLKEFDAFLLSESIYLAMVYSSQRLIDCYGMYIPEPAHVWRDLNQLYKFALDRKLAHQQIDDPMPDTPLPVSLTIDFAYKRILLLALAEPYHLLQYEADDIYRIIASMVESCAIEPFQEIVTRGEFLIESGADHGPQYVSSEQKRTFVDPMIVDISAVKTQLSIHLQRLLSTNAQQAVFESISLVERQQRDMLLRLADSYNATFVRKTTRFNIAANIEVTSGLNAAHYFISEGSTFTPEMNELKFVNNLAHGEAENNSMIAVAYREAIRKDRKHEVHDFTTKPWNQRDVSPVGISINCPLEQTSLDIRVGELLTYRVQGKKLSRWQIGVAKWIKHELPMNNAGSINTGIMNLANGAIPVGTKAITGLGSGTDYFRSLLIPKQVSLQQTRSLIVPALLYDVGTVITVNLKDKVYYAKLTRMMLSTRSFTQFDFEVIDKPVKFIL